MRAQDVLNAASWESYSPSAQLEQKLFLDGWLRDRKNERRKRVDAAQWEYCQDPKQGKLRGILSQVATWRHVMGRLSHTNRLLTRSGAPSRLRVILSTGLRTPTGVVTEGSSDASRANYLYESDQAGDGTVEEARVLDDLKATAPLVARLHGVPHGRLMIDPQFLSYFTRALSNQPMTVISGRVAKKTGAKPHMANEHQRTDRNSNPR